jgi:hypothetical protein
MQGIVVVRGGRKRRFELSLSGCMDIALYLNNVLVGRSSCISCWWTFDKRPSKRRYDERKKNE